MNKATILLVEDDRDIMRANRSALELEGYPVKEAGTLREGRELVEMKAPDLIVLDITLPDGNGLEYCRELRGKSGVRILFLSALNTKADLIAGLRAGGDDYITKPYLMDELIARIEALLRRGKLTSAEGSESTAMSGMRLGAVDLNFMSRRASLHGSDMLLKPKEFSLLEVLAHNEGRYITAGELYEKVWGLNTAGDVRTVHAHIYSLRRKLGKDSHIIISQKRGKGYMLRSLP